MRKYTKTKIDNLMKIGEVAKTIGVSINCIRDWSNKGIIKPIILESGHRLFDVNDVLSMKKNKEQEIDYVGLVEKTILEREGNLYLLLQELLKFEKINDLKVGSERIENNGIISEWYSVSVDNNPIFVANHIKENIYEFSTLGKYKKIKKNNCIKIYDVRNGSMNDLLSTLSEKIIKMKFHINKFI